MNNEKQYNLGEAIKKFYKTEPLNNDLASTVASKVFEKQRNNSALFYNWLYFIISCFIIVGVSIYCYGPLSQLSLPQFLLLLIVASGMVIISIKEFSIFSKRVIAFHEG